MRNIANSPWSAPPLWPDCRFKNVRLINSEGRSTGAHITMAETVERFIRQLRLESSETYKMTIAVPAEFIGRDDCAMTDGPLVSTFIPLSPALVYKSRLE